MFNERWRVASGGAGAPAVRASRTVPRLLSELRTHTTSEALDVQVDLADGALPPLVATRDPLEADRAGPVVGAGVVRGGGRRRCVEADDTVG